MKISWSLIVLVVPSLNVKSEKSPPLSPFKDTTPLSSTFTFFPSPNLEMSGRESFEDFYNDFYIIFIKIHKNINIPKVISV